MTFTSPTEDIIVQEGTFAFDYLCSGAVSAGQGVTAIGTMAVEAPTTTGVDFAAKCVGVAAYDQTHGNHIAVYGPGNIVRVIVSGTSVAVGDNLKLVEEGKFREFACANASGVTAIALETQGTANGTVKVLLV